MWYVYILEAGNGQLYTGITNDIERRVRTHRSGRGAKFTRMHGVKYLCYQAPFLTKRGAMKREAQIKTWPRQRKLDLIDGVFP